MSGKDPRGKTPDLGSSQAHAPTYVIAWCLLAVRRRQVIECLLPPLCLPQPALAQPSIGVIPDHPRRGQ